jgi:hypothetical protein
MVLLTAFALLLPAVPANAVGAGSAATPNLQINYSIADIQFDGPGCVTAPVTVDYVKVGAAPNQVSGRIKFDLRYEGSNSPGSASIFLSSSEPGAGRLETTVFFCPHMAAKNRGPLQVTGTVQSQVTRSPEVTADITPSSVAVNFNPVKMSRVKVKKERDYYVLSGTATAQTPTKGVIGAGGKITIQLKKKGSKRWVSGTTASLDSFGTWSTFSYSIPNRNYPKGTQFRAIHSDCRWCADASRTGKLP